MRETRSRKYCVALPAGEGVSSEIGFHAVLKDDAADGYTDGSLYAYISVCILAGAYFGARTFREER